MDIDTSSFYLLRIDINCCIVDGQMLKDVVDNSRLGERITVFDIAGNFFSQYIDEKTYFSYQRLYKIKNMEFY